MTFKQAIQHLFLRTPRTCSPEDIYWKAQPYCLHHCSETPEEALGGSFTGIKVPLSERSLHLNSKEAISVPPSSAHLRYNDKDPQEALQRHYNAPSCRWTLVRHKTTMSNQDETSMTCKKVIVSHLLQGILREIWAPQWEATHQHTQLMSSLSFLIHPLRKEEPKGRTSPPKNRASRDQIIDSNCSRSHTCHPRRWHCVMMTDVS